MLCHIYHHALHDRFLEGRDLLLMSHLQDNISNVGDVSTMILFNRMMVVLGLAAFRLGRIRDAHQCLSDVCSGRVRELLAQGINTRRYAVDKTAEQEKAEKRRQIPYHQHIHLDLLEACHLISAMLLEVPNMAASNHHSEGNDPTGGAPSTLRRKVISRTFRKHHDIYERQMFTGPPEQTRDYIMKASTFLMKGEWKTCADLLSSLDVWGLIPGVNSSTKIKSMLVEKIKQEGLRTYLCAYSLQYDSLSLHILCDMFDLPKNEVHSIVSKMMINRELHASWDQPTETIVLRRVEPSALQLLTLQYAEKTSSLMEANERLLDTKSGTHNQGYGGRDTDGGTWNNNWKTGGDRDRRHHQMSRGGGRGGGNYGQRTSYNHPSHQAGGANRRGFREGRGDNAKGGDVEHSHIGGGSRMGVFASGMRGSRGNSLW